MPYDFWSKGQELDEYGGLIHSIGKSLIWVSYLTIGFLVNFWTIIVDNIMFTK